MYRFLPLVLILAGIALGMATSWPIYDDSLLEILVSENGPQASFRPTVTDRFTGMLRHSWPNGACFGRDWAL